MFSVWIVNRTYQLRRMACVIPSFLAHLSHYAHWWAYSIAIVSPSTIFKDLLQNRWANWSQISYGASVGLGNRSMFVRSGSQKSSPEPKGLWPCGLVCSIGPIIVCSHDDPRLTLTYFMARSNLVSYAFIWGKLLGHLMEETYTKQPEWQKVYKNSDPKGLSVPALGLYTCMKTWKIMYKIRLLRYFLKLATNGQSDKAFLLTSGFCPQRVVCPCPGAIYMWEKKNVYKIRNSKRFVWDLQQMVEVIRAFCWHQNFVPKGFSALSPGLYTYIKSLQMCIKSDFEEIILKLATYGQREKAFLLS